MPPKVQTATRQRLTFRERWVGEALAWLEVQSLDRKNLTLILTENPCPEYAQDLLELQPGGLIVAPGAQIYTTLGRALPEFQKGESVRIYPSMRAGLLPSERLLLRYLPYGDDSRQIAVRLGISHKTVRNRVAIIGEKLHLENRLQIVMYYTGQWQWLPKYREALEVFCDSASDRTVSGRTVSGRSVSDRKGGD